MDDLNKLLAEVNRSDSVIVPYTSHGKLRSWARERFGIRKRRYFWLAVMAISFFLVFSSGGIFSFAGIIPVVVISVVTGKGFNTDHISDAIHSCADFLTKVSPVDYFFRVMYETTNSIMKEPSNEHTYAILGIISVIIWVLILNRVFRDKTDFSMDAAGLSLIWHKTFSTAQGPVVPWSEIKSITFRKNGSSMSEGFVDFTYTKGRWKYKLDTSASRAGENVFALDLRNLNTLEQRHAVGRAIEKWAPPNTVQPEVVENLSATQAQAYTELWLQALTAPSKRQSLDPLSSGKQLQGGKYQIRSQLAVGGQGTAYLAQSAEPIAGFPSAIVNSASRGTEVSNGEDGNKNSTTSLTSSSPGSEPPESDDSSIERQAEDDGGDHIVRLDSSNIVVKEFVLPLFVDANSRKNALRKFLDEADLLKRLDHERVVKLSDCFVEDHRGYLVLERIYGDSLHKIVLENGPFTEGRVLELLDQMLDVLSYLHSQVPPVVHRDFAPDNLILGQDGILKLVDFNVAQQAENSVVGTIVGKQSYVPPEQLRGLATPASDIYALGATLFFLLTAQNPEPLSVSHPIDIVPHISKEIDQLVAGCTRLDETDRFKTVDEIRAAMNKTLKWHEQNL